MITSVIIGIVVGLLVSYIAVSFFLPRLQKQISDQFLTLAQQKLATEKNEIKTDLTNKKEAIEDLVKKIKEELNRQENKFDQSEKERIGAFNRLAQQLTEQQRISEQLVTTTEGLRRVLSNNQLRGQFGEQVAENLLKMAGFVKGVDYQVNKQQESRETRPDFTVFLPNKVVINVDAKFPYANLQKMIEAESEQVKKEHLKTFKIDVKAKIKQVLNRNYINPEENTVDFVILFIPNEMIFSFIYDKLNDVWQDAMASKVILAGPFSFTAILQLVRQAYDNFKYQKNIQKIITYIKSFEDEFEKYNQEFSKIGDRIESLTSQYNKVNFTRTNKLTKVIDRIKLENSGQKKLLD